VFRRNDGVRYLYAADGCHDTNGRRRGQIGYRWQTGAWVFGLEGQAIGRSSGSNRAVNPEPSTGPGWTRSPVYRQIGYAWNTVLLYAKGGAAVVATQ